VAFYKKQFGLISAAVILILLVLFRYLGIIDDYYITIIDLVFINIILAVSLNLTIGFLGQLALGNAGFMAIGAYTSAILTTYLKLPPILLFPVAVLCSGVLAVLSSLIVGIPSLRLKGDYLAIITLGFGEIIKNIITGLKITGGARGYKGIMNYNTDFETNAYVNMIVLYLFAGLTVFVISNFTKSRHGRVIKSIRDNEIASEASGVNIMYYKLLGFSMSAFFAGVAGSLYAHHNGILAANKFDFNYSIEMVIMVVLGGMGNIKGSIAAAIFLTFLPQLLSSFSDKRMLFYSILLIIVMLVKNKNYPFLKIDFYKKRLLGR
jgi:branched-chain amino acid transport system permease protein